MKYTARLGAEYQSLWDGMTVSPAKQAEARKFASKMLANKARYKAIEVRTGVPWFFVALVHYRESTLNFSKNLCNGQPLSMRTTIVPIGRGPYRTFEDSAFDSLVRVQKYSVDMDWSLGPFIHRIEGYNGYGYHNKGVPSPYLWGGSNRQKRGKYIRDGVYDPNTWDTQLGVLTILRALMDLDPSISFDGQPAPQPVPPPDVEPMPDEEPTQPPPSPKTGGEKTPGKSKTIWASILAAVSAILSAIGSVALDWKALAVFLTFITIVALVFIGKERIRKIFDQGL